MTKTQVAEVSPKVPLFYNAGMTRIDTHEIGRLLGPVAGSDIHVWVHWRGMESPVTAFRDTLRHI